MQTIVRMVVWDIYRTCSAPTSGEIHRHFFHEGMRVCLHVQCFAVGHPKRRKQHALEYQDKRNREAQVCEG